MKIQGTKITSTRLAYFLNNVDDDDDEDDAFFSTEAFWPQLISKLGIIKLIEPY